MNSITQSENAAMVAAVANKNTATQGVSADNKVDYGKTIGDPKLSDKAQKYYDQLKKKYSNMDFILVSEDQKANAQANAASYANPNKTVVLIDTDKIEKMAEDENFRKKYEGIISNSSAQLSQLKSSLAGSSANVKGYGMQINDGGNASFFAVIDKSQTLQKERIAKKAAKKAEEKKAEAKKEAEEKIRERIENNKSETVASDKSGDSSKVLNHKENLETITASSIEELIKKINDTVYSTMSDNIQTEQEKMYGQHIDFRG